MTEKTPVDEIVDQQEKRAAQRKQKDFELWQAWKSTPDPQDNLDPLLKRFEPTINRQMSRLGGAKNVQPAALKGALTKYTIQALESWDPDRPGGAALHTHVTNFQRKALRDVNKVQNLAGMSEAKTQAIGPVQRSFDTLRDQLGREPSPDEIAEHLRATPGLPKTLHSVTGPQVGQIMNQQVKDIPASAFESDPAPWALQRDQEVLDLLPTALSNKERVVFDAIKKNPKMTNQQLATQLGMSPHQTHRLREKIYNKYKKYK